MACPAGCRVCAEQAKKRKAKRRGIGRYVFQGKWVLGHKCPACKALESGQYRRGSSPICPECGDSNKEVVTAVRWVRTKTGFWPWQTEGHFEERARRG